MGCCGNDNDIQPEKGEYKVVGLRKHESRKYDEKFKGPIDNRSCTDICFFIFFIICISALVFISFWAYMMGDIKKILHPTNSHGELCGFSSGVKNKSNLVFFNLFTCINMGPSVLLFGCPTKQICVEKCPNRIWTRFRGEDDDMVCVGGRKRNDPLYKDKSIEYLLRTQTCAEYVFPSVSISGRCVPDFIKVVEYLRQVDKGLTQNTKKTIQDVDDANVQILNINEEYEYMMKYKNVMKAAEITGRIYDDLRNSYKQIVCGFLLGGILSLLYIFILRYFAVMMVWMTIVLFVIVFIFLTIISFMTYHFLTHPPKSSNLEGFLVTLSYKHEKFWLGCGIGCGLVLLIIVLVLVFLRERIQIAIKILVMTSKSLEHMIELMFSPIFFFVLQLMVVAGSIMLLFQLASIRHSIGVATDFNNVTNTTNSTNLKMALKKMIQQIPCVPGQNSTEGKICTFIKYGTGMYVYVFMAYAVFMLLWLVGFVGALSKMTIAGSFASYYFTFDKAKDIPSCVVLKSFWRAIRYHIGSLAFGSFILAVVQFIRMVFEYLESKVRNGQQNIVATLILKCCNCCLWCLEKFIKFLNKNAYIMIAIYGQNFCSAAKNAFNLLLRNAVRVVVVDKMTDIVLFMGRLIVVGLITTFCVFFFNKTILTKYSPELHYFYVPVIIITVGCYIITSIFFSIYDMGADTIFLCFCEDLERNDGSPERRYYMSSGLMKILGKSNKAHASVSVNGEDIELKS